MNTINLLDYPNCTFGKNVDIRANHLQIEDGVIIGDNVTIYGNNVCIGFGAIIQNNVTIKGLSYDMRELTLGDHTFIGFNTQILTPYFKMLDYSQLHNSVLCSGYEPLNIGYNCWIGQGAILNCFKKLTIGNNVRMGGCQVWTHVASGELLEGCTFHNSAAVNIEDNVWLMGFGHLISPGITLARNSIIMAGSVVTKCTEPYKTYSGIPALDVTRKLNGWKKVTLNDKFNQMQTFIAEFETLFPHYPGRLLVMSASEIKQIDTKQHSLAGGSLFFLDIINNFSSCFEGINSYFCLTSKQYVKKRTQIEIEWMKFSVGFRARFVPVSFF